MAIYCLCLGNVQLFEDIQGVCAGTHIYAVVDVFVTGGSSLCVLVVVP